MLMTHESASAHGRYLRYLLSRALQGGVGMDRSRAWMPAALMTPR